MRKIAVLGLGRFGMRLARELGASGLEVIAADRNGRLVDEIKDHVTVAVQMDMTDEEAMRAQSIGEVDVCVVAIGEGLESSLLTTLIAKKLGARQVIARAQTQSQADILARIGADQIIQPENDAARELARRLVNPQLEDFIELDDEHGVVQLRAPQSFRGKTLAQLKLRSRYQVNVVAIKRQVEFRQNGKETRERTIAVPGSEEIIQDNDILVLVGHHEALTSLPHE